MIQGEIHTLPLTDLLQWLALKRSTGKLAVKHANHSVEFYFINGEIAAASTIDLDVLDRTEQVCTVLGMVLGWNSGSFAFDNCALPLWVASANLRLSVEALLLDVASLFNRGQKSATAPGQDESSEANKYSETFTLADALRLEVVDRLLGENFTVPAKPQLAARVRSPWPSNGWAPTRSSTSSWLPRFWRALISATCLRLKGSPSQPKLRSPPSSLARSLPEWASIIISDFCAVC
jgi:hypothetical protein